MTDLLARATAFNTTILVPAIEWFRATCPKVPVKRNAHVLMLAIAGQESGWEHRIQSGNGPAHGHYQFERMGGVNGVLTHPATAEFAGECCRMMYVKPDAAHVWAVMATERGDKLATAFARLLLWSDPRPLPDPADEHATYRYYEGLWRPGKPRPRDWPGNIRAANHATPQQAITP